MGYVMIENHLSAPRSHGWKSVVEPVRDALSSAFLPVTIQYVSVSGCFKCLTADFHPRLCRGIFGYVLCHH